MGTTFITVDPFVDLLTANGTVGGVATVADSDKYIPGQAVTLRSGTQPDLECYVTQIVSPTEIGLTVRTRPWLVFATQTDISAYLTADTAELETVLQVVETSLASDDHLLTRATERTLVEVRDTLDTISGDLGDLSNLDVPLSTRASEATLALVKAKTDNLDVLLSTRVADATITARLNTLGQKLSAESAPVVIATDQLPLPVAVSAGTDRTATGSILTVETVEVNTMASGACGVVISGTWTGTIVFEATVDDTIWTSVNAVDPVTGDEFTDTTVNGTWIIACAGFQKVRLRGNVVTSGTATGYLTASTCPQVVTLGAPLPTGTNNIGSVTANIGTTGGLALDTTLATRASESTVASILAQLDVALSTRASEATAVSVLGQLDVVLSTRASEATLLTRASESTVASILAQLDVALSTRASEATATSILSKLDVDLSTRASEATLALIKAKTDNLDVLLSTRAAALTQTDGTQKSIVRGGAKGATVAADVTSTAEGADHQGLDIQIYHGGVAINPTQIRTLTSADTVTAVQGTAAVTAGAWPVKVTDGTNVQAVKAASTAALATDPSAVVALSPNSPLPAGTNIVGSLVANQTVNLNQVAGSAITTQAAGEALFAVEGRAADGAAVTGNPVLIAGQDGTNAQSILTDTSGRQSVVGAAAQGAAVTGNPLLIAGEDVSGNVSRLQTRALPPVGAIAGQAVRQVVSQTATTSSVAASATSVQLLAANTARIGARIVNDSNKLLYVKAGTTASLTDYTKLLGAGEDWVVDAGYTGRLDGIWESANGNARMTEYT